MFFAMCLVLGVASGSFHEFKEEQLSANIVAEAGSKDIEIDDRRKWTCTRGCRRLSGTRYHICKRCNPTRENQLKSADMLSSSKTDGQLQMPELAKSVGEELLKLPSQAEGLLKSIGNFKLMERLKKFRMRQKRAASKEKMELMASIESLLKEFDSME